MIIQVPYLFVNSFFKVPFNVDIPVSVVGNIYTIEEAEEILASGQTDIVGMCRSFMAEPTMIEDAARGREDKTQKNVVSVRDVDHKNAVIGNKVVVCGGGLTGVESALQLAREGKNVTVVDMVPEEVFCKSLD